MENTEEFKNLVDLLESPNTDNVVLGLQVAQNYKDEFLAYFGYNVREMKDLLDFLVENNAWNARTPLLETTELYFKYKNLQEFPIPIYILKNLKTLVI